MDDYPDFPEEKEEERIPLVSAQKAESDQMQELIRRAEAACCSAGRRCLFAYDDLI